MESAATSDDHAQEAVRSTRRNAALDSVPLPVAVLLTIQVVAVTEEHYADDHQRSLCIWWLAPAQDGGSQHAIRDAMMVTS